MSPANEVLLSSDLWQRALEKFGSDTHLSVQLFDACGSMVHGPVHSTPLFQLFEENGYDPGIFAECARRCLEQKVSRPAVVVSEYYGLAVVGTSLMVEGEIVGAAVAGYAFVDFSQLSEVQRLARNAGIKFEKLWRVAREQKPVSRERLTLNGELLQVLGDALLQENYRTRRYEEAVISLEESARSKDQMHQELRHAVSALRESEEHYRALFELGPVAVYSCDLSGVILEFNRRAAELWGRTPDPGDTDERFCGSFKLFRPDGSFMPHEQCPMADVVSGRAAQVLDAEVFIERTDGSRITVIVNIRPLKNEHGEVTGAINCFYDITERKKAELATAALAAIVEFSDDAIISKDLNGVITSWNKGSERLFGYTAQEAIGQPITMLIPPSHLSEEPEILRRIRHGESIEHYETVRRRKDGKLLDISLTVSPIRDSQGCIVGASKVAHDITGRRKAAQALRESQERVRKSEKMAVAGQLAASMAHEINNPLSAVTNLLYLLETHPGLDESAHAFVNTAAAELARVSRIVKQSLSYYRVGTIPHELNLGGIVNESLQIFSEKLRQAGIEVKSTIDNGTMLLGFADELRQVVDNLLLNATEAMPEGGRLTISVRESFDWIYRRRKDDRKGVRLTIADTGCGIPAGDRARIFEPFFTTKSEKGTGLGLWVLQGIVAKHEGVMSLRSSATANKSGTVISIFLPSHARGPRREAASRAESAA